MLISMIVENCGDSAGSKDSSYFKKSAGSSYLGNSTDSSYCGRSKESS